MARKSPPQIGKRRQYAIRNGSEYVPLGFGGMYLEGDPGTNAYHRPRHLENVRFKGGGFGCKDGLSTFGPELVGPTTCIPDISDYQPPPKRVYLPFFGCPGISAAAGFTLVWFDTEMEPQLQRGPRFTTGTSSLSIGNYGGKVLAMVGTGSDVEFRQLEVIVLPYDDGESLTSSGDSLAGVIETFAGVTPGPIEQFAGLAFLALNDGAATSVSSWDGLTIRPNDLSGVAELTAFGRWRDVLIAGHAAASNLLRFREPDGTWYSAAPGAGTIASVKIVSYKDIAYVSDGGANIWSVSGTTSAPTIAIVHTIAGATIRGLAEHNGFLYYGYRASGGATAHIGQFDGSVWTDAHKNLTTDDSLVRLPNAIVSYRGGILVAADTLANGGRIYTSPGNSTSGTYVQHNTFTISLNGSVTDAVVVP